MVDTVEELLQIQTHYPAPAVLHVPTGLLHRLSGVAVGPEAVAVFGKVRVKDRAEYLMQGLLDQSVRYRGYAQ